MAYEISWLIENRVVHLHVFGTVSIAEARQAYDALLVCHEKGTAPIHLILEHTGIEKFPLTLNPYNFIIEGGSPAKGGWMLIVGDNRQARFLGMLFSYVAKVKSRAFLKREQALEFLYDTDATLRDNVAS